MTLGSDAAGELTFSHVSIILVFIETLANKSGSHVIANF